MSRQRRSQKSTGSKNTQGMGEVRIIGGDFRGRKLPVLLADGLRPTSDRVRETIFNWLQFDIAGARCLDAFAGSGAIGLEALSRGAKKVVFLDALPKVQKQLQQNLQTLKVESQQAQVICTDAVHWAQSTAEIPFDVIFLDPPFHKDLMHTMLQNLFDQGWVGDQTLLYLEQEKSLAWPELPEGWSCRKEKTTSQVRFGLFTKQDQ
ncbi:Ribosomal RNA small subunit methyltransferase D [uncultured Thiomicrorhabdus sp.]|jgi:16S rRNA (guanine966-N2)-methyltransferase